jgi:DNA-directed RNA polymerase specialized sigma24 family protein
MTKQWTLNQQAFDSLLEWLDGDREQAGRKYEDIRRDLIRRFTYRGCAEAEALADETINRVTRKVPEIAATYVGAREPYFFRVASYVLKEYTKKLTAIERPPQLDAADEKVFECLDACLNELLREDRDLVLLYYSENKQAKIELRRELAAQRGISLDALRIRLYRIRRNLRDCVEDCLKQAKIL